MIEEFIPGREIQVAILGNRKLGAIELKPKRKFYDYEAKYNAKAKTKHIIPVEMSKKNLEKVLNIALKAHNLIGCKGVTRSDFKFFKNRFFFIRNKYSTWYDKTFFSSRNSSLCRNEFY